MPPPANRPSTPVYSTDTGRLCAGCGHPANRCACSKAKAPATADGIVRIARQTKGRKGKAVASAKGKKRTAKPKTSAKAPAKRKAQ